VSADAETSYRRSAVSEGAGRASVVAGTVTSGAPQLVQNLPPRMYAPQRVHTTVPRDCSSMRSI
jgi:hypothetical protein